MPLRASPSCMLQQHGYRTVPRATSMLQCGQEAVGVRARIGANSASVRLEQSSTINLISQRMFRTIRARRMNPGIPAQHRWKRCFVRVALHRHIRHDNSRPAQVQPVLTTYTASLETHNLSQHLRGVSLIYFQSVRHPATHTHV